MVFSHRVSNYKLIGWAFEYVVRDNFNWNWVIYIYYALEKLTHRIHLRPLAPKLEKQSDIWGAMAMSSNEIEFCNFAAKRELNGVMWRRGYALFVFWLILGECSKMSIAIRNCGQSTNTKAISTPFDVIWALSISHSNELKRDEACSRTIATTSIFPPHFRKFRINLIVKQRLLLKCYFSCTENRPSNSIGRLCCCSNSSNKNEWIQKRATELSHPLVTECENMNPHIHNRHPAKCTVVVESLCCTIQQKVPNTTKINHDFIYARKSTNSLKIELDTRNRTVPIPCMDMVDLSCSNDG